MSARIAPVALTLVLAPAAAEAHAGHWGPSAGHDHWIALGALGVLGLAGLAALVRERRRRRRDEEADDSGAEDRAEGEA